MPNPKSRLTWVQHAPEPGGLYTFEISRTTDTGHPLWELRPEDWPLLVWEMDGFSLDEAKDRGERLAGQHVPVILRGEQP